MITIINLLLLLLLLSHFSRVRLCAIPETAATRLPSPWALELVWANSKNSLGRKHHAKTSKLGTVPTPAPLLTLTKFITLPSSTAKPLH